jgi:hypothetical protein
MTKETFVEVYEVDLKFCYLQISNSLKFLIVVFPCGFKDFYGIYWLRKEGVTHFKMIIKKIEYIILYFNFFTYYEQGMEKSKFVVNNYNNVYQGWHEQW